MNSIVPLTKASSCFQFLFFSSRDIVTSSSYILVTFTFISIILPANIGVSFLFLNVGYLVDTMRPARRCLCISLNTSQVSSVYCSQGVTANYKKEDSLFSVCLFLSSKTLATPQLL